MLKKLPQEQLEEASIAAVSGICRTHNWDFIPQTKDKSGIDAEINIVHGITRTGLFLKCQLKAGRSYISSETDEVLRVRIESKYLTHWYDSNVQIALFFYEPLTQSVYWKDIRDHLRAHPNLLSGTQETRIIEFHKKMDLLTPETLPVLEQVARGEFHYGFISLEESASELAVSNRFASLPLPSVWVAPTPFAQKNDICVRLQQQYAFAVNDGLIYTMADIRKAHCELGHYCDKPKAVPRIATDIPTPILTEILNMSRDLSMLNRGLDSRRERFYFPLSVLKTASTNKFSYLSLQGKQEERTLIYVQNTDGRQERKHHAVKLSFSHESGQTFLELEPDWQFTFPLRISPADRKARLISEKAGLHNKEYLYLLHFWKQYLSQNSERILFTISSNPTFGNVEFSSSPIEYVLPFRMMNDYFGPKQPNPTNR
ncbi:MAG TPA: DUF4365 domain-containing protein [Terriglobales bacterium]|nr:DUF4365 domain-containing protein [Terriglobales bacterium]